MNNEARAIAAKRMVEEAETMGEDAIVNIRYASSAIMQRFLSLLICFPIGNDKEV